MLLVDNSPINFANQLANGVPIIPYFGKNEKDCELVKLGHYLKILAEGVQRNKKSLKKANRDYFKFDTMKNVDDINEAYDVLIGRIL